MSKTLISWTDETANPLTGCTECDPACLNCYARVASASPRLQQFEKYHGVVDEKGRWTNEINFAPEVLEKLLHKKKPCKIFMPSMSDMFHPGVKDDWIDQIMAAIALTPHITYQILTKRPERMLEYFSKSFGELKLSLGKTKAITRENIVEAEMMRNKNCPEEALTKWPLPNLWLGVTAGTQKSASDRIPYLQKLGQMGYITFVSVEPMLEKIDFTKVGYPHPFLWYWCSKCEANVKDQKCCVCGSESVQRKNIIHQVIIGGESGPNSRPFHLEWAQSLIEQCHGTNTKVFMKQVGSNAFYQGKPFKTKSRAGSDLSEWPEWAQIQEFPNN